MSGDKENCPRLLVALHKRPLDTVHGIQELTNSTRACTGVSNQGYLEWIRKIGHDTGDIQSL